MIKFTIITITYNAELLLKATADSVLKQTYPNVEHLIIDGASMDDTLSVAKDYMQCSYAAMNGHEIKIVSEPDNGIYYAMNKGLEMASGDYLCFLNAGDRFPNADVLEKIVKNTGIGDSQAPAKVLPAVLYGETDIIDENGKFLRHRRLSAPERLSWQSFKDGMLVCHQAFYVRTDISRLIRYNTKYRFSADVDWCIRVMKEAERLGLPIANAHAVLANYVQEGQTTEHHRESLKERYHVMTVHYGHWSTLAMHVWFAVRSIIKR
jgi:glycosyltransferase involved in cell wall biosynthesis